MSEHQLTEEQIITLNELKKDTSEVGREVFQNYAIDVLVGLHSSESIPEPEPEPEPEPSLPNDGRPQQKGANKDAKTWKVVPMNDDPTLFKIIDDKGINVADQFRVLANAEEYIAYYIWKQSQEPEPDPTPDPTPEPEPEPTPDPTPTGEVKMIYKTTGKSTNFKFKSSNPGRAQWVANTGECYVNQENTGYLFIKKVSNMGEEVSMKLRGGPHTDRDNKLGCCYIMGIEYQGGVNSQTECPHPSNSKMNYNVITPNILGNNIVGKWFGIKGIVYQEGDHDKIECWIDPDGLIAGKPANNWKLFWETTSTKFTGKCNGKNENTTYFRLDDVSGDPESNVELKFASCKEIVAP